MSRGVHLGDLLNGRVYKDIAVAPDGRGATTPERPTPVGKDPLSTAPDEGKDDVAASRDYFAAKRARLTVGPSR